MSSQPQTYTPAQYLEAGHRAEMAGERERAAQYYHYLAEAFSETLEGDAARTSLARLSFAPPPQPHRHVPTAPMYAGGETAEETYRPSAESVGYAGGHLQSAHPQQAHGENAPSQTAPHRPQPQVQAHQAQVPHKQQREQRERASGARIKLGELSNQSLATRASLAPGDVRGGPQSTQSARVHDRAQEGGGDEALRLPEVVARRARELADFDDDLHFEKQYRGARLLAHLVTWSGWIAAAGGLALVVLGFVGIPTSLAGFIIGLPSGVVIGFCVAVAGLALMLAGQVALATFDQAQTMREIGLMLRARVDL